MTAERVVGWVVEGGTRHPVGQRAVTCLGSGARAFAVRSALGPVDLLLVLPPGLAATRAGVRVETATILRPGESLRTGDAAAGTDLEFALAAEFGTAAECRADRCDICGEPLTAEDRVARCPVCSVVACVKLCASAHQCTRCGAALVEEHWT